MEEKTTTTSDRGCSGGGDGRDEGDEDEFDPEGVREGRMEEVRYMVERLEVLEFESLEEAWERGGKMPTTAKWVDTWKMDEQGGRLIRSRLVRRDFKPKRGEVRDDIYASMPPPEAKKGT